jgi:hypothetical protein
MNIIQKIKNSPSILGFIGFILIILYVVFIAHNPQFPLLNFNEEFLLIINFFLLIFFLMNAAGELIGNFLQARHNLIKDEAHKLLTLYKDSANKLRVSYSSRRDLEDILYVSFLSIYKPYTDIQKNIAPYTLNSILNRWTLLQLSLLYREEINGIRSNYIRKLNLLKSVLASNLDKELKLDSSTSEILVIDNILSRLK